jgi:hypothetical protein
MQLIRQAESITPRTDPRSLDTGNEVEGNDVGCRSYVQDALASGLYRRVRTCIVSEHKLTIDKAFTEDDD